MALIVEDGTGLAGAESYCSVAYALDYHTKRGNTKWLALTTEEAKERSLRKATDYMRGFYGDRWAGQRLTSTQSLDWPRYGVVVDGYPVLYNSIPLDVMNACAELALRSLSGDLASDQGPLATSKTVGPLSITYAAGTSQDKRYTAIDNMLGRLLSSGNSMIRLVRA